MNEIRINGVKITMTACHCGAQPTEIDAARAIEEYQQSCHYCKEPILMTSLMLSRHDMVDGKSRWDGSWQTEPSVYVSDGHGGFVNTQKRLHVRCWEKIFGEKYPITFAGESSVRS